MTAVMGERLHTALARAATGRRHHVCAYARRIQGCGRRRSVGEPRFDAAHRTCIHMLYS